MSPAVVEKEKGGGRKMLSRIVLFLLLLYPCSGRETPAEGRKRKTVVLWRGRRNLPI